MVLPGGLVPARKYVAYTASNLQSDPALDDTSMLDEPEASNSSIIALALFVFFLSVSVARCGHWDHRFGIHGIS
jgi:hypothetical protein